ncbi:MAG: hypothetical protein ABJR05_15510 [Balneola sp.]
MFKKTVFCYFSIVGIFILLTVSCEIIDTDCGPFYDRFKTTGFDSSLKKIAITDSSRNSLQLTPIETDTISYDEFSIQMISTGDSYTARANNKLNFSIWSKAYACSPPIVTSDETVLDIQIFSSKDYNSEFSANENISELFDIIVYYNAKGNQRFALNDFVSSDPEVPVEIILLPQTAPSSTSSFQFTVKYFQDGLEMDEFEFTTDSIVIKK